MNEEWYNSLHQCEHSTSPMLACALKLRNKTTLISLSFNLRFFDFNELKNQQMRNISARMNEKWYKPLHRNQSSTIWMLACALKLRNRTKPISLSLFLQIFDFSKLNNQQIKNFSAWMNEKWYKTLHQDENSTIRVLGCALKLRNKTKLISLSLNYGFSDSTSWSSSRYETFQLGWMENDIIHCIKTKIPQFEC